MVSLVRLTAAMTATAAGGSIAAWDPRANVRARSYHASPGGCKASVLCIRLWMLSINRLVSHYASVDGRGCGKVDNCQSVGFAHVVRRLVHKRTEVSTVQPVGLLPQRRTRPLTFRYSGVPYPQLTRQEGAVVA